MNFLERTISVISPQWAYRREAWRRGTEALHDSGSRSRMNMNWNPELTADENRLRAERDLIRSRARDLERNSDVAEAVINAFERNVVGTGLVMQAKTAKEDLNKQLEDLWKEFCKAEHCDITASQSMEEIEEMLVRRYVVDGGVLIMKVYTEDKQFPFKLQIREVDELSSLMSAYQSNRVVDGIEIDKFARPIAYHFKKFDGVREIHGDSIRIAAKDVIFWRRKTSSKQVRELSMLRTAINRIKDANQFIEAVSVKERVLACLSVFIKKAVPSSGVGRGVSTTGKGTNYDGMSLAPGMVGELNPGDEVQTVIPSGQASNSKEFITTLLRLIGAGLGISYEAISRDLSNVNYSSARQGLLEDRKTFKKMQRSLINTVLNPIYREWVSSMILVGRVNAPIDSEEVKNHVWIPPGSTWIDPVKEVTANKIALETNQDTLARICAERGEDYREIIKQRAEETKLILALIGGEENAQGKESTDDID